jgi:hypothetical protein
MGERTRKGRLGGKDCDTQSSDELFSGLPDIRFEADHKADSVHRKPIYLPISKLFYAASSVDNGVVWRGQLGLWEAPSLLVGNVAE